MSLQYLLPCECGRTFVLSTRQAGETLVCECGRKTEVPTLRGIRNLEVHTELSKQRMTGSAWTQTQGWIFVAGVLISVCAFALWGYWSYSKGQIEVRAPDLDNLTFAADLEKMDPADLWTIWRLLDRLQLDYRETPEHLVNQTKLDQLQRACSGALVGGCLGLVVTASSFFLRSRTRH